MSAVRGLAVAVAAVAVAAGIALALRPRPSGELVPPAPPATTEGGGTSTERDGQEIVRLFGDPYAIGVHGQRHDPAPPAGGDEGPLRALDALLTAPERLAVLGAGVEALAVRGGREGGAELEPPPVSAAAHYRAGLAQVLLHGTAVAAAETSAVAVAGERGAGGHALLAANLVLAPATGHGAPALFAVVPKSGLAFVAAGDAGPSGVLAGMNERGLSVVVDGADAPAGIGTTLGDGGYLPLQVAARRLLEGATAVGEALAELGTWPLAPGSALALADRSGAAALVVQRKAGLDVHREPVTVHAGGAGAPESVATARAARRARLVRLVSELPAERRAGPGDLLAILRDRRAPDGGDLPIAHGHAIDALAASHSIIIDAGAGVLWLGAGPHTLGPYLGYDVARLLGATTGEELSLAFTEPLPADQLAAMGALVRQAREAWTRAREALARGETEAAATLLRDTAALADHPITLQLRGDLAVARGEDSWAQAFYRQALLAPPETDGQADALRRALRGL